MKILDNPWHHGTTGWPGQPSTPPFPVSTDSAGPLRLLDRCPAATVTPLLGMPSLARACSVAQIWLKDERERMGLGSFKALGAAYVIADDAARALAPIAEPSEAQWQCALKDHHYVTASAGNHGLSLAAGARLFGAKATVFLSQAVPPAFASRLQAKGARVEIAGEDYDASMQAASAFATANDAVLLSDSSWPGYCERPHRLMQGYLVLADEIIRQCEVAPTHVFVQAGVGGLAAATAALLRAHWQQQIRIIVVEPEAAPALHDSIRAGRVLDCEGPDSNMGRLDCKTPSLLALAALARDADQFMLIDDDDAAEAAARLAEFGIETTPSGVAGLAALMQAGDAVRARLALAPDSRILAIISEGVT